MINVNGARFNARATFRVLICLIINRCVLASFIDLLPKTNKHRCHLLNHVRRAQIEMAVSNSNRSAQAGAVFGRVETIHNFVAHIDRDLGCT